MICRRATYLQICKWSNTTKKHSAEIASLWKLKSTEKTMPDTPHEKSFQFISCDTVIRMLNSLI